MWNDVSSEEDQDCHSMIRLIEYCSKVVSRVLATGGGRIENHEEVIDLGAPRAPHARPRARHPYTPNPRLYPAPKAHSDVKKRIIPTQRHRSKRKFTRPVPNSRLYRPQPAVRSSSPPTLPRISWPPPTLTPRQEDTASRAALHVLRARHSSPHSRSPNRIVLKLPVKMEAANRHSTSPECSDGNDASSAPSEFLAEFLSAIMRRQYAEALKYCRLILQYEPHNNTARGFYPLLQHKLLLNQHKTDEASSSEDSPRRLSPFAARDADVKQEEVMQQEADSPRSSSCSSLELDSSDAPRSSRSASPSRRTDPSDRSDRTDHTEHTYSTSSHWDSGGERSDRDDNGNSALAPVAAKACGEFATSDAVDEADVNDNATPPRYLASHLKSGSSLQQLRAQFACSIK